MAVLSAWRRIDHVDVDIDLPPLQPSRHVVEFFRIIQLGLDNNTIPCANSKIMLFMQDQLHIAGWLALAAPERIWVWPAAGRMSGALMIDAGLCTELARSVGGANAPRPREPQTPTPDKAAAIRKLFTSVLSGDHVPRFDESPHGLHRMPRARGDGLPLAWVLTFFQALPRGALLGADRSLSLDMHGRHQLLGWLVLHRADKLTTVRRSSIACFDAELLAEFAPAAAIPHPPQPQPQQALAHPDCQHSVVSAAQASSPTTISPSLTAIIQICCAVLETACLRRPLPAHLELPPSLGPAPLLALALFSYLISAVDDAPACLDVDCLLEDSWGRVDAVNGYFSRTAQVAACWQAAAREPSLATIDSLADMLLFDDHLIVLRNSLVADLYHCLVSLTQHHYVFLVALALRRLRRTRGPDAARRCPPLSGRLSIPDPNS